MFEQNEWKDLQRVWEYCMSILDPRNLHAMQTKAYQVAFRRLSSFAVTAASAMLVQKCEIWSIILGLETCCENLNSLSFLSTRSYRIKYSPRLERKVQELVADLKFPGPERNH